DVKVRLRVSKTYSNYVGDNSNGGNPAYVFNSINTISPKSTDMEESKRDALDRIKIVPNPYYAYSSYEQSANKYEVRFTNVVPGTVVTVYTPNGLLVRRLIKANSNETFIAWNLQNDNDIPIASGMYIIHVNAPGLGEKSLK